ncbi:MAG TPA: ABC transporter ATP-binding protein [Gemmatimonadaceae bacterium]
MSFAIETNHLNCRVAKSFSISDLSMHVPERAVYGFLGPNGSGKTTTIRLLLGLLKPASGSVAVLGHSMPQHSTAALARTGYVPERLHLYPSLTVSEAIQFHRAFYPTWDEPWAGELTKQFQLDRARPISVLSKGETGKLMMLLALAQRPDLLVLDEPTDGLDPVVRRDILGVLAQYVTDRQATVLISSHLVHELERICDWVGLMDQGRLVAELPMMEFKTGLKRLRISGAPASLTGAPFTLLVRDRDNSAVEEWLVRGWKPSMQAYLESVGASLREVVDLDLEEGFVEMLRASRRPA